MATANFKKQKYFDLYVYDFSFEILDDNENETGEYDYNYDYARSVAHELNKISDTLRFFKLELEDGYYLHTQIYVNVKNDDVYSILANEEWIDGSYCFEEYGVNKYILQRMIFAEMKKINNVILPKIANEYGFEKLNVIGSFSNGEVIYELANVKKYNDDYNSTIETTSVLRVKGEVNDGK